MKKMQLMLDKQRELQARYNFKISSMNDKERTEYIKNNIWYLISELDEVFRELPYGKAWKNYDNFDKKVHLENAKVELIDCWHFFMNIMMALNVDAETLFSIYCDKNKINHDRIDSNYGKDEK